MTPTTGDLSFFFKIVHGRLKGLTGAYIDDIIGDGDREFEEKAKLTGAPFKSKAREYDHFQFVGIQIKTTSDRYSMNQEQFARMITVLSDGCTFSEFRSKRHELAWLTHTLPDLSSAVNLCIPRVFYNTFLRSFTG